MICSSFLFLILFSSFLLFFSLLIFSCCLSNKVILFIKHFRLLLSFIFESVLFKVSLLWPVYIELITFELKIVLIQDSLSELLSSSEYFIFTFSFIKFMTFCFLFIFLYKYFDSLNAV